MFNFPARIAPYGSVRGRPLYRLQGLDTLVSGSSHLNFAYSSDALRISLGQPTVLSPGQWIGAGTFRNSLFLEPWAQFSQARDLHLQIDFAGALRVRVTRVARGRAAEILHEVNLLSAKRTRTALALGSPGDAPEACRIFWHVEALELGAQVHDIAFCAAHAPREDARLAVLMRTFGRTSDVKSLLRRFVDAAAEEPFYAEILDHVHFWLLDTTAGSEGAYQDDWLRTLNLDVRYGPNLGGGGNAGHLLQLFEDACDAAERPPTEVLILDDDLSLSMESLARYFMFTAYRAQECLTSLPVLMKSRPNVVWEDGGFWGRLNFQEAGDFSRKRNLFPALLKHGLSLDGFDQIDNFSPLNTCEYSTFIFFGLSMKSLRRIGLPAAFFLRGDDIELSLRAQEAGLPMITNPNLAAWHEPAHSYGQEYMAILHGIIINFTYGEHEADFYARFFEERMHEHASIDDAVGLGLYRDILAEILDPESQVLTRHFQHHYLAKLKALGAARMTRLPDADREALERRAREEKTLLVPFVYPGYQGQIRKFRNVVLINHSQRAYREVPPMAMADKIAVLQDYTRLLGQLTAGFDAVRERWQKRLKAAASPEFWAAIRDDYAAQTTVLLQNLRERQPQDGADTADTTAEAADTGTPRRGRGSAAKSTAAEREGRAAPAKGVVAGRQMASVDGSGLSAGRRLQIAEELIDIEDLPAATHAANAASLARRIAAGGAGAEAPALPFDFDAGNYLALNPDVQAAGLDPSEHFMRYGRLEGRRYRL